MFFRQLASHIPTNGRVKGRWIVILLLIELADMLITLGIGIALGAAVLLADFGVVANLLFLLAFFVPPFLAVMVLWHCDGDYPYQRIFLERFFDTSLSAAMTVMAVEIYLCLAELLR